MTSDEKDAAASPEESAQRLSVNNIYLKDLSFESPRPVERFDGQTGKPSVDLQIEVESRRVDQSRYEVLLGVTATARLPDSGETLYLVEVKQAGLFGAEGFSDEKLHPVLHVYCPNLLFPYAREVISGMVERGGFPQLLLQPVNFDSIYQQNLQKRSVKIAGAGNGAQH